MKYRANHNGDPIVDATPEETHALRPCVCACLRRYGCPEREIDDIAQHVEIITWQAIGEGRVHGYHVTEPRDALLGWMLGVAQNAFRNHRNKGSTWREVLPDEPVEMASRSPVARLEARDLLRRIEVHPSVARLLVDAAIEVPRATRREDLGASDATYHWRLTRARKWARRVVMTGVWRKPPMAEPMTPRKRKKKR